jgi:predicted ribosome quality control (RQC) complex YloA/Tae2 family protein
MHVDYLTLACLRDDMDACLGARVQEVLLVTELTIGLELYARQRRYLVLCAEAQTAHARLSAERVRRGHDGETPLLLRLRKFLRGARLMDIAQPAWERILAFDFAGPEGRCRLIAEIMDRYSNLILVGPDGCVLDAAKRIGPGQNRYRVTLPGQLYVPPPTPAGRQAPRGVDWESLLREAPRDQPLHRALTGRLLGVSPTLACEAVTRAAGDPAALPSAVAVDALARAMTGLLAPLDTGEWEPHLGYDDQEQVLAFAPYRLQQCPRSERMPDISTAIERFLSGRTAVDAYAAARREVQAAIAAVAKRLRVAVAQITDQLPTARTIERLREDGELLLAYQHQIAPGSAYVTLPDHRGEPRCIELDASLSPLENAQALFTRYTKARRAAAELPTRLAQLQADQAYLDQLAADLAAATTRAEIDAVRDALAAAGWLSQPTRRPAPVGGPSRVVFDGYTILVGRNARQNEEVTFKRAAPDDLWLHVRGRPGPHVIIKSGGQTVPESVVAHAAALAARCPNAPVGDGRVPVDVTRRRHVRRMPGDHPGMVTYRHERTIWVSPCPTS